MKKLLLLAMAVAIGGIGCVGGYKSGSKNKWKGDFIQNAILNGWRPCDQEQGVPEKKTDPESKEFGGEKK